jgi:hypothetical protein
MADPFSFWPYNMPPGGPAPMASPPMNVPRPPGPPQPLSPNDFQGPGAPPQAPHLPRQWGGPGTPEPDFLSPEEKRVMRGMLNVLKQGREAMNAGMLDGVELQRLTAAHAWLAGFCEARGMGELGAFLMTIPPPGSHRAGDGPDHPGPAGFPPFGP